LQQPGGPDLLCKVITSYLQSSTNLCEEIGEAADADDAGSMARAAHTLKSSSGQLGGRRLQALCKDLELQGKSGSIENAVEKAAEIRTELEALQRSLAEQISLETP
jgi:HPt (histidine-containing phosphotransfer) domain-containing protein